MARKFSKLNFVEAVKIITPDLYLNQDADVSGSQIKFTDLIINSHLRSISQITNTLNVSAIAGSFTASDINTPTGFSRYFIKQNKLTDISLNDFVKKILTPLSISLTEYSTLAEFREYLRTDLLPKIRLNSPDLAADTSAVFGTTNAETHEYLINNLGWLYFLNTNGPVSNPSSMVINSISNKLYAGKEYKINDAIKDYQTYLWTNYSSFSSFDEGIVPSMFLQGISTYTSGNQNLEKLNTFIDIIYSPLHIDREEITVKNAIEIYIGSGKGLETTEVAGPLNKFYRAISYLFRDIDSQVENLELLTSISECPKQFLPYLSNLIGWRLRGNNEASWRNQIANAVALYKKKGTKQGLVDALDTVIVNNPIDVSSSITELYESYLPSLLYYLLKTDTEIFDFPKYDSAVADGLGVDVFDPTNKDTNIRAAVDLILKRAVERFPYLFFLRNEPYRVHILETGQAYFGPTLKVGDQYFTGSYFSGGSKKIAILGDPGFTFKYRGRDYPIPPWEEEKFYKNCIITDDLLWFFKNQLKAFCVSEDLARKFLDYTNEYTLSGVDATDIYIGNSYVFFTSSQQYPPNYKSILSDFKTEDYDLLSLWNGKSSTFDFSVCAGHFSSTFFGDASALYTVAEILESLDIVDEFIPAKAIPRVRIALSAVEQPSGIDFMCPTIKWPIEDVPASSTGLSNYEVCGVYDRGTGFALGYDLYLSSFDDSRSTNNHDNVPVFKRNQARYSNHIYNSVVNTSAVVPAASGIPRRSLRRRDFYNTLGSDGWYGRDGANMPSFYNNTSSILDFSLLGYIPSALSFAPPTPENLSAVYSRDCRIANNDKSYFDIPVSSTFSPRGNGSLSFSSCDQFVRRDQLSQEVALFFGYHEKKKKAIAKEIIDLNYDLLYASSYWVNLEDSFANQMNDEGFDKFTSPELDIRNGSTSRRDGLHSIYNYYNQYFLEQAGGEGLPSWGAGSSLPESVLDDVEVGGPTILSHTYGPIYHNANFSINASAVDLSSTLISTTTNYLFNLKLQTLYDQGNNDDYEGDTFHIDLFDNSSVQNGPYYGAPEYRCNTILSSISFIDTSTSLQNNNKMGVYFLERGQQSTFLEDDNYLINNKCVLLKNGGTGLPRVQFPLRGIDPQQKNILIPEHEFELSLDFLTAKENSRAIGGGGVGIIIRTKNEQTKSGDQVFFVWTPEGKWEQVKSHTVINGTQGINNILKYAHKFSGGEDMLLRQNANCDENVSNNSVLSYVNKEHIQTAKINFHTKNTKTELPFNYATYYKGGSLSDIYNGRSVQLHRALVSLSGKTQNYMIEIFPLPTNNSEGRYVILDTLRVMDKTLNDAAAIPYSSVIPDINTQKDGVLKTRFILPDGDEAIYPQFATEGLTNISTEYFSTDLFRAITPGITQNYELWGCAEQPWGTKKYSGAIIEDCPQGLCQWYGYAGLNWDEMNQIVASYSAWFSRDPAWPSTAGYPQAVSRGLPWGKIPYTGVSNGTYTAFYDGFDQTTLENLAFNWSDATKINNKKILLEEYWAARKGFLSYNHWSPYIHRGRRALVGVDETGDPFSLYATADGPGRGCFKWSETGLGWPTQEDIVTGRSGYRLQGLARPGHASIEQHKVLEDNPSNPLEIGWGHSNPMSYHPLEEFFSYHPNDIPPVSQPPTGELYDFLYDRPSWEYTGLYEFPWGMAPGSMIMLDFTSRRMNCGVIETGDVEIDIAQYDDYLKWNYSGPGEDPLLPLVLDPTGTVASSMAIWHLINSDVLGTTVPSPSFDDYDNRRLRWDQNSYSGKTLEDKFLDEGHGITFPPLSIYKDISKDDLVHDQYYTFSTWVATSPEGFPDLTDTADLEKIRHTYATSAILTISPIGSKNSYTRLVLSLPDPVALNYPLNSATSSILTNGHSLLDTSAARCREETVPIHYATTDRTLRWFRMEVTMPYDAFELDSSYRENLGIRCTLQAINGHFDSILPPLLPGFGGTTQEHEAERESYITNPCRLNSWGSVFNVRPDLAEGHNDPLAGFTRMPSLLTGVGGYTSWNNNAFQQYPGKVGSIIYVGEGSVVHPEYEVQLFEEFAPKKVYNVSGELSIYTKDVSSLQKITVVKDAEPNNEFFKSRIYNQVALYDNSGVEYQGDMELSLDKNLLRPRNFDDEFELERRLLVSGTNPGTNIVKNVEGIIPVTPKELLHTFRYFNKIGKGVNGNAFNSRNAVDSAAIHSVSGGSRLDYTINPDNPHIGTSSTFGGYTRIDTLG